MKKIKTLVYCINDCNGVIDILEDSGLIVVPVEYETLRENSIRIFDTHYFKPNQTHEYKYQVPYKFYKNFFEKYFFGFLKNWERYDASFGNSPDFMHFLCQYKRLIDYCYNVLLENEIELIIHKDIPHEIIDFIFISIGNELGIKTLYAFDIPYLKRNIFMLRDDIKKLGSAKGQRKHINDTNFNFDDFLHIKKFLTDDSKAQNFSFSKIVMDRCMARNNISKFENMKKLQEFENILKHITVDEIPKGLKYAYFPLHYQPEAATIAFGVSELEDQSTMIEYIAKMIPNDMYIVVKEHYLQTPGFRDSLFYQKLAETKKVIFVSPQVDSLELTQNAIFTITISGSVGFETLLSGKPVVYGGYPLYEDLPGAFRFDENFNIDDVLNFKYDEEKLKSEFTEYLQTGYDGCIIPSLFDLNCTKEENNKRLADAYTDYINELFEGNDKYFEDLKNTYATLKAESAIKNNNDIPKEIQPYLPDLEYFTKRRFKANMSKYCDMVLPFKDKVNIFIEKNTRSIRKLYKKCKKTVKS